MRHRRFLYKGQFKTKQEISAIFGLTPNAFDKRLKSGWKLYHDELIPKKTERKKCWTRDCLISKVEYSKLRRSFLGDSEFADNLYC